MVRGQRSKPLFLFYLLVAYVLVQFIWWAWLIYDLNQEVFELKAHLAQSDPSSISETASELSALLNKKLWMVVGEGSVFLLLLILGFLRIRSSFKREVQLNRQQRNFLMSVTHELRSPIASVQLMLETFRDREIDQPKKEKLIRSALQDTKRLEGLVDNLLLATQIENKRHQVTLDNIDLSELVTQVTENLKSTLAKQHQLECDAAPGITISADPLAITSILSNLIENAAKYSPGGSRIQVSLKQNDTFEALIEVSDEGVGIPEEERPKVLNKFYRVGNEETRSSKGTGLGLFIVKHLVQAHNGSLGIRANTPKGTTLQVRLPLAG